jgi:hypothetical protein
VGPHLADNIPLDHIGISGNDENREPGVDLLDFDEERDTRLPLHPDVGDHEIDNLV